MTSFQTPLVALATPCCKLGLLPPPVAVAAGAPRLPPVTGASTTVTDVWVLTVPSGSVNVDRTVELEGVKETSLDVASTVVRAPLPPLLPETEKTILPFVVATGVAERGVEIGTAWVDGAFVAVVRDETGRTTPLDVDGAGAGDWPPLDVEPSCAVLDSDGLLMGATIVVLGLMEMVVLLP